IRRDAEGFGAITTVVDGGRNNGLTEQLGSPESPGIGFGMGVERLMMALESEEIPLTIDDSINVDIIALSDDAQLEKVKLMQSKRQKGLKVDKDYMGKKMKAQLKNANRLQARVVVIIGENELETGYVQVRTMSTGEQEEVSISELDSKLFQLMEEKQS